MAAAAVRASGPTRPTTRRTILQPVAGFLSAVAVVLVTWELGKWVAGDPWRFDSFLGTGLAIDHDPPLRWIIFNDLNLPHVWEVVGAFVETDAAGKAGFESLLASALFTLRGAVAGFFLGAAVGLFLAILLVHVRLLERAFVPLIVASQTIPIVALAPIIVVGLHAGWLGIAIVASYLTFFPVTIAAIRGLRAADARAFELMRSYAANRRSVLWKLRLPASVPYLFTALKISATASIVGAIVGELPSGFREGLGGAILLGMQYYTLGPEQLWATVIVAAGLGFMAFIAVVLVERWVLRNQRPVDSEATA